METDTHTTTSQMCTCSTHCVESPYHESACCSLTHCPCWCHENKRAKKNTVSGREA